MSSWDDYAEAELLRVMQHETVRHPIHGSKGGEWDALNHLPRNTKRTLTGAQMLTPQGLPPDVAAEVIEHHTNCEGVDECMDWYVTCCLTVIRQRRRIAWWRRHHRLARRNGYRTYWYYRKAYLQQREEAAA